MIIPKTILNIPQSGKFTLNDIEKIHKDFLKSQWFSPRLDLLRNEELREIAKMYYSEYGRLFNTKNSEIKPNLNIISQITCNNIREMLLILVVSCYTIIEYRDSQRLPIKIKAVKRSIRVMELKEKGLPLHDIAKKVGCSISTVKRDLKSLDFP